MDSSDRDHAALDYSVGDGASYSGAGTIQEEWSVEKLKPQDFQGVAALRTLFSA